jgi:WD40 repeat protein
VPLEHQGRVWSAAFSPDGTRVVTASDDKTARVWDAATSKPLTGPLVHQDEIVSATFTADGSRVITVSRDSAVRIWDVRPEPGTLDDWTEIANRSQFVVANRPH